MVATSVLLKNATKTYIFKKQKIETKIEGIYLNEEKTITVRYGRSTIQLDARAAIYALMERNYAQIYFSDREKHKIRTTFTELQELLGPEFVQVKRGCLVKAGQIQQISDMVYLKNGQALSFVAAQKNELVEQVCKVLGCQPGDILGKTTRALALEKSAEAGKNGEEGQPGEVESLSILVGRKEVKLPIESILYIRVEDGLAAFHMSSGEVYRSRASHCALQRILGERFVFIGYNCLVSGMAIHSVGDRLLLCSGEELSYAQRRKGEILRFVKSRKKRFIDSISDEGIPKSFQEYEQYYRCFQNASFAFTDIEMVFSENQKAIDWIFRYGNQELSRLEKLPLEHLIGSSFRSLFPNMDSKWLRCYEQAVLYGKTLEIEDYSREIRTNLRIICFPTFKGHCGCILFNADKSKK